MEVGYFLIVIAVFAFQYGSIDAACACPRNYDPVCGVDGKTYGNDCTRRCAGVLLAYKGECKGSSCVCPYNYDPVCGINGKTYPNECVLKCDGIPMAYPGECIHDLPCACPLIYQPVCGEDGRTYGNLCALQCKKIRLAHNGECQKCPVNVFCPAHPCHLKCPLFPFAVCLPGCACNSRYFINGVEVTRLCNIPLRRLRKILD